MASSIQIILASTSPYRRQLLERLGLEFDALAPTCDEEALKDQFLAQGSSPAELAQVLAQAKAQSIASEHPQAIVIGSDQLAQFGSDILGKPGSVEAACSQLERMSGQQHQLLTAVSIYHQDQHIQHLDQTQLQMSALDSAAIKRYVERDMPLDCAGAYKLEAAGISLFERIQSDDHSAITGLPLLFVCKTLRDLGITIP